jgi:hypothetical protein
MGELTGRVVVRVVDAGSKSEHPEPVVVDDEGREHRVHVVGDNPFEKSTLRALEGRRIEVEGTLRGRTLRVMPNAITVIGEDDGGGGGDGG